MMIMMALVEGFFGISLSLSQKHTQQTNTAQLIVPSHKTTVVNKYYTQCWRERVTRRYGISPIKSSNGWALVDDSVDICYN